MTEPRTSKLELVGDLFGRLSAAAVTEEKGMVLIGYREGRDVCVIARGKNWEDAYQIAQDRVRRTDRMLRDQPAMTNPTVATAAAVPVRFVRIRRRDLLLVRT